MALIKRLDDILASHQIIGFLFGGIGVAALSWIVGILMNISIYYRIVIVLLVLLICLIIYIIYLKRQIHFQINKKGTDVGYYTKYNIMDLLTGANNQIFVIGITNLGLFSAIQRFEKILDSGVVINIVVESNKELMSRMSDFYFGVEHNNLGIEDSNMQEIKTLINSFRSLPRYDTYMLNHQINIREARTIISSSHIGIDITQNYQDVTDMGQIQSVFYQYGLSTDKCPCIRLSFDNNHEIYKQIGKSILNLWKDSNNILS